ncbi:DUF3068 domain-containing protein [Williamsia sp.]|uniref:DUF3068 domain-containing protein n=1 Tax=Williamsia sp. TaxID=1872085 RepID=UPI001A287C33|nr:DUF3068 domain-containing protein [Williamsia sp.]MBJ7291132.1 DUF3068 domain-containing protein [Williamsia sp.]
MKKLLAPFLVFIGVAAITAAIAVPTWLVPKLEVVPLDLDITTVSQSVPMGITSDNNLPARVFDRCSVGEDKARVFDANVTQQRRTVVVDPSDADQATVQSGQTVRIDRIDDNGTTVAQTTAPIGATRSCNDGLLSSNIDILSVDRKTSAPNGKLNRLYLSAGPDGQPIQENEGNFIDVPRKGYQYKFPFDTKKQEYPYFDANTRRDLPAEFVGETKINGLTAYEFVSEVPEIDQVLLKTPNGQPALGTSLEKPAAWWGIQGIPANEQVVMHRFASATRHVWVEPETGTALRGLEVQHQYFKSPGADDPDLAAPLREFRMDAFHATVAWNDATIDKQSDKAQGYVDQLRWGGVITPIVLGVVGAIALIAGVVLLLRRRDDTPAA